MPQRSSGCVALCGWNSHAPPIRRSKYGDLGDGNHAVVLAAIVRRHFVVLDPYFDTNEQPVQCSRDDFAAAWTGEVRFYEAEMFSESEDGSLAGG